MAKMKKTQNKKKLKRISTSAYKRQLKRGEAADLLWKEWEYRHSIFWQSLYRWGGSAIAILLFPFLRPEIIGTLGNVVSVFLIIAGLISLFGFWHLGAEYSRLSGIDKSYRRALGDFNIQPEKIAFPYKLSIGWTVAYAFLLGSILMLVFGILVLIGVLPYMSIAQAS